MVCGPASLFSAADRRVPVKKLTVFFRLVGEIVSDFLHADRLPEIKHHFEGKNGRVIFGT